MILTKDLPYGRTWGNQIDLIRIAVIEGLYRSLCPLTQAVPHSRTFPDLLSELGQTLH